MDKRQLPNLQYLVLSQSNGGRDAIEDDRVRPRVAAVRLGEAEAATFRELRLTEVERKLPAVFAKRADAAIGNERRTLGVAAAA